MKLDRKTDGKKTGNKIDDRFMNHTNELKFAQYYKIKFVKMII